MDDSKKPGSKAPNAAGAGGRQEPHLDAAHAERAPAPEPDGGAAPPHKKRSWFKALNPFARKKKSKAVPSAGGADADADADAGDAPPAEQSHSIFERLKALPVVMGFTTHEKAPLKSKKHADGGDKPAAKAGAPKKAAPVKPARGMHGKEPRLRETKAELPDHVAAEMKRRLKPEIKVKPPSWWVRNRQKVLYTGLGAVALSIGLYAAYWMAAANGMRAGLANFIAREHRRGIEFAYKGSSVGGFPLTLRLALSQPSVTAGSFQWQGDELKLESQPWRPLALQVLFPGSHRFDLGSAHSQANAGKAVLLLDLGFDGRLDSAALAFENLTLADGEGKPSFKAAALRFQATLPPRPATSPDAAADQPGHLQAALRGWWEGRDLVLPKMAGQPLGADIASVSGGFQVLGTMTPPSDGARLEQTLEAWRDDGGTIEISDAKMRWGPLSLRATGTLALDNSMQPIGAMTTELRGFFQAVDALVATQVVQPRDAALAKVVLGMLVRPGDGALKVPLTVQDGKLHIGRVALTDMPEVAWPDVPWPEM